MMGYGYGGPMMDWEGGNMGTWGTLGLLTWLVWLAVGILLAVYLWQKITQK